VEAVAFISDRGDRPILASGSWDKTIKLWNWETGEAIATFTGHTKPILSIAISPDGQILASGSWDKTIKLWQIETGELITTMTDHSAPVECVAFSPPLMWEKKSAKKIASDFILASGSLDGTIKLWQGNSGKLIQSLTAHTDGVRGLAFSPDGEIFASASVDKTVKLWNLNGEHIATIPDNNYVFAVAFSPDGQMLASGGEDKNIKVFQLAGN
jgi:WD40 repeat protein